MKKRCGAHEEEVWRRTPSRREQQNHEAMEPRLRMNQPSAAAEQQHDSEKTNMHEQSLHGSALGRGPGRGPGAGAGGQRVSVNTAPVSLNTRARGRGPE